MTSLMTSVQNKVEIIEKKKIEMDFHKNNISIYSKNNLERTQQSKVYSMTKPTAPIKPTKDENGKESIPAFKKRMTVYDAEVLKYEADIIEWEKINATPPDEESEDEYDEDGSEEGSDEEESDEEEEETASPPASATVVIEEEEDEEVLFERQRKAKADLRMAELKRIQDEEDEADRIRLQAIKAKKMRKDIDPLRAEATAVIKARQDERNAKITALLAEQDADTLEIQRIQSGEMDEQLIKAKTDGIKITPTIAPPKTASAKAKTDGNATRTRTAVVNVEGKTRPKGGDIMALFNQPALIRCVFGEHKTAYYGMVEPAHKRIRTVEKNGVFRFGIDKGVKSFNTKTIKIEVDGKIKNKDVADTSEPERVRTEWTTKDLWIKSCKGEQDLYSSTKDGWKEIYYWNGDPKTAGMATSDDARWVHLHGVAYDGVKLN